MGGEKELEANGRRGLSYLLLFVGCLGFLLIFGFDFSFDVRVLLTCACMCVSTHVCAPL